MRSETRVKAMENTFLNEVLTAFPNVENDIDLSCLEISNVAHLPSWFETSELASASIACAGLMTHLHMPRASSQIVVDQRLASLWFDMTLKPVDWDIPPPWDPIAGDYQTSDGWIRLHTNAPHHRKAALSVIGDYSERDALARAVARWNKDQLENEVVEAGGCAAAMNSFEDWQAHPQGKSVANEPLIDWDRAEGDRSFQENGSGTLSLSGVKVLDLTRILAGPVGTRYLAAYGADVLRIDPLDWDEPSVAPEVTLGKRCAGLDLKSSQGREVFCNLVKDAEILVHGYRPNALANLGFDGQTLRKLNPSLIDISLCAYGWNGPWKNRRGFDSLVQMSCGIAGYGMRMSGAQKPVPLPVQALDHATGYFMAAAALYALHRKRQHGEVLAARLSLARTAQLLMNNQRTTLHKHGCKLEPKDMNSAIENTGWGDAHRVRWPLEIAGREARWSHRAAALKSASATW